MKSEGEKWEAKKRGIPASTIFEPEKTDENEERERGLARHTKGTSIGPRGCDFGARNIGE